MREGPANRGDRPATCQQELLLKAALSEGPASLAAWTQWRAHVDPQLVDYDSQRLLPLLYSALLRQGLSDPQMGRLKGVYRRTWYDNALRFRAAGAVLRSLRHAGIETMLLDGAALVLRYYRDIGLRPLEAVDILVPSPQGQAAARVLKAIGWTPIDPGGDAESDAAAVRRPDRFRNRHGHEVDLHRHVLDRRLPPIADSEFWAAARPGALAGVPTRVLSSTDQLLNVCAGGTKRTWWSKEDAPNPAWVADAMMILRHPAEPLDWQQLAARAQQLRLVLPLREALNYLRDLLDAPVPASALARIRSISAPLAERIAEHARTRPPKTWSPWAALGLRYLEYTSDLPPGTGMFRRLVGAPAFFQRRWGAASLWHLPVAATFRGLRRIWWAAGEHRVRRVSAPAQSNRL